MYQGEREGLLQAELRSHPVLMGLWKDFPLKGTESPASFCYSKSLEMLKHSVRLLIHYLKFWDVPVPVRVIPEFSNAC